MSINHNDKKHIYRHPTKLIALAVVAASLFWSCNIFSDEKVLPYNPSDGISFASSFEPATRNIISSLDDIKFAGSKISLFGRVTLSDSGVAQIFNNTELAYQSATDSWTYSPIQYWLSNATYDFAGFYPYKSSGFTHNTAAKTITYAGPYVSQLSTTAQEDILVGAASRDVAADGKGVVTLPLKHALAAVRFSVRNATENDFVVIGQNLQGIKNQGSNMTYDGSAVTWGTVGYASGTTATTSQYVCASGVTTTTNTYENSSATISRVYYRNNAAMGVPSNYSNTTLTNAESIGTTMPYIYTSSAFTSNTATGQRNEVNYYYNYDSQTLNGGISVPISATSAENLYSSANFSPNSSNYMLDDEGYLLVLPQTVTDDAKLNFTTAIASIGSITLSVASTVYKYVYNVSKNNAKAGQGTLVTYRTYSSTNRTITNVPTVATTPRTVALANLASVVQWEAGKKYDYTITVSTSNILISVTVVPWVDREIELK